MGRARQLGIVESVPPPSDVDLMILAAPVGEILALIPLLGKGGNQTIILDLGSTKIDICKEAERFALPFIGGHPMTGSERSGPEAATADIFKGARFFLCPIATTPEGGIARLERLLESIGAIPHVISPEDHDKLVAEISHLPQILATLLAEHTLQHRELAGPGLKSVTRLAASPFHVWRDILKTSGYLPQEIQSFIDRLRFVLDALKDNRTTNLAEIEAIFERANRSVSGEVK
jgi:prephenate dehydrogenase